MSNRLLHTKVGKKKPLKHFPKKEDGHNGDMQIVDIKGKGTYLCLKSQGDWRISDKFNIKSKVDTQVFKQIQTPTIKGISGTALTLKGRTTTLSSGATYTQPIVEIGSGSISSGNIASIISSKGDHDIILKTGNSSSSSIKIIDGASGNIQCDLDTNASLDALANRTTSNPLGLFRNTASSGTADAYIQIRTASTNGDVFLNLIYDPTEGSSKQWSVGMDANDSDAFKILGEFNDTAMIGIDDTSVDASLKIDTSGNMTISGDLTISGGNITNAITCDSTLTISTIAAITSDTDKFLVSDSGVVKYVTGDTLLPDILTAGTNCTLSGATLNVDDAFILNDARDIMAVSDFGANAALKIDADQPATAGAEDSVGLWIDYDRIVAGSGTAVHNDIGIDLDVNAASLGTSFVKGMDIDVVGATSGIHTAVGIDLDVDSADTNIGMIINTAGTHMKLVANADTSDYATFTLADTGDLTIATVGDGTTDSDLTLDVDGLISLDSANGKFVAKNAGTEFSVANSAYGGMILGYTTHGIDLARQTYSLTTSFRTINSAATVRFIAPPSGVVEVEIEIFCDGPLGQYVALGLSDNATYNSLDARYEDSIALVDESDVVNVTHKWIVTGLTAGNTYNYWIGAKKIAGIGGVLQWGGTSSGHYGPLVIKVTALPTAVSDFAVYG